MASRKITVSDRIEKDKIKKKQDSLFNPTVGVMEYHVHIEDKETNDSEDKEKSNIVNNKTKKQGYKRQTYFLSDDLIQAIAFKSVFDKMDKSEIVREALKSYIEDKYFNMK